MTIGWVGVSRDEFMAVYDHMRDDFDAEEFKDVERAQNVIILRDKESNIPVLKLTMSDFATNKRYINGVFYDGYSKTD